MYFQSSKKHFEKQPEPQSVIAKWPQIKTLPNHLALFRHKKGGLERPSPNLMATTKEEEEVIYNIYIYIYKSPPMRK